MKTAVKPIPEGYHSLTPYLVVPGVAKLIVFLREAFGAVETGRHEMPDGTVMHAEVRIGDSLVMMGEPRGGPPIPGCLYHYVEDCDAVYQRAIRAGATSVAPPTDQFYGDRHGGVKDPSGNLWWIGTRKENVPVEEITRRALEAAKKRQ